MVTFIEYKGDEVLRHLAVVMFFFLSFIISRYYIENIYCIVLVPLICFTGIIFLIRTEINHDSLIDFIKNKEMQRMVFTLLKYSIILQGISNLFFLLLFNIKEKIFESDFISLSPMISIYSVFISPIVEEIVFRKIIFSYIDKKQNFWIAAIISSLLFSSIHGNMIAFFGMFCSGILFCYFYKKIGSIIPLIISHVIFNFLALLINSLKNI